MASGQDQRASDQSAAGQGGFYVSIQRAEKGGIRTGLLLGPYGTKEEAGTHVDEGRNLAEHADSRAVWDAFGVTRVVMPPGVNLPTGVLNALAEAGLPQPRVAVYRHPAPVPSPAPAGPDAANPPASARRDIGWEIEL